MQPTLGSCAVKCSTVSTSCSLTVSVCFLLSKAADWLLQLLQHLENEAEQSGVWLKIQHGVLKDSAVHGSNGVWVKFRLSL